MPSPATSLRGPVPGARREAVESSPSRSRPAETLWRFGLWLRRSVPVFREERALGRALIRARACAQTALDLLRRPRSRSLKKALLCLRLAPRYTMIAPALLSKMYDIAEAASAAGARGSIVECGVWNGGSAALLAMASQHRSPEVWLFDSFQGLPPPTARDPEAVRRFWYRGWNTGDPSRVSEIWRRLRLPRTKLHIRCGWFDETFPGSSIESISILHIDCDWYDSVKLCLDTWYDRVEPGGAVILNDYNLYSGATQAVHDFLRGRGERIDIFLLGRAGGWWTKPAAKARDDARRRGRVASLVPAPIHRSGSAVSARSARNGAAAVGRALPALLLATALSFTSSPGLSHGITGTPPSRHNAGFQDPPEAAIQP